MDDGYKDDGSGDGGFRGLKLTNTMSRTKEEFRPLDWRDASIAPQDRRVRMYVCGPTVYDFAHIGNARPVIVFDVLFRLLRHLYGEDHVVYARNITDVDDKINARAARDFPGLPLNEAIRKVTETTANQFHADVAALGCLPPTYEPRATDFVTGAVDAPRGGGSMVDMIETLIARGHAYEAGGEVLFDVTSMADYGRLSNRKLEDQRAGARVAVDAHKRNPGDFVLWKLSDANEPGWEAPFGQAAWTAAGGMGMPKGRPGWHLECSVMSEAYLGRSFDIHGGGIDLVFPHHENEIAQSRCAHGTDVMAQIWMHNGFLQVEGRKMAKSDGNFVTIRENLRGNFPGWQGGPWHGLVLKTAMLLTHYTQPIDWKISRLLEARSLIWKFSLFIGNWWDENSPAQREILIADAVPYQRAFTALLDDIRTADAIKILANALDDGLFDVPTLIKTLELMGIFDERGMLANPVVTGEASSEDIDLGGQRFSMSMEWGIAFANGDLALADNIKSKIEKLGWMLRISSHNSVDLDLLNHSKVIDVDRITRDRLEYIRAKNFVEADRIRDDLLAKGIQLKDGKDPETGERVTTWEVKR